MLRAPVLRVTLLALAACARREPPAERKGPPPPEPVLPPVPSASPARQPAWVKQLPSAAIEAAAGSSVWAAVPQPDSEMATVGVYRLESTGDTAVLVDKTGQRVDGVPAALVHPVGDTHNLKEGTLALFYTWTTPGWLGIVSHAVRGDELRVSYDWAGVTKETTVDHAEAARKGIVPLAYVGFPKAGTTSMGQIVALDATRAWLLTGSGHVEVHPRAALEPLEWQPKGFTAGQKVRGYRWATGFERGSVAAVLEPGLRYDVAIGGAHASYFLTALVAAP